MINMFDRDRNGTISYPEFVQLWKYITDWLNCFKGYDRDNSGSISQHELQAALSTMGYRLSDQFYQMLIMKYDRDKKGAILFDDFIQCCITLQTLTAAFRAKDTGMTGTITVTYEDFLKLVMDVRL